jgi:uncharacterized protein (TIGR03435 family)
MKTKVSVAATVGILFAAATITLVFKENAAHKTPNWQKTPDLSSLEGLPPQAKIIPSLPGTKPTAGVRHGKGLWTGQDFTFLVANNYDVLPSRVVVNVPMPNGKYDWVGTYPQMRDSVRALQEEIKKMFKVTIRREMIETNVLIMTVSSPYGIGLSHSTNSFSNHSEPGSYSIRHGEIYTLILDLEDSLHLPIIDETRTGGRFDFDLNWDSTPDGLKQALKEKYHLELTPARRVLEFVVVDKQN